ncbi:MAG: serine hydrolase domain-containing protein [Candidatus Coproplasma sp.]
MDLSNTYELEKIANPKTLDVIKKYCNISPKAKISLGIYKNKDVKITDDRLYYIGSISKVLTSLLVLKTIYNRKIDIHTDVNVFLKLKDGNYPTIYECLTHTYSSFLSATIKLTFFNILHGYSKKNPYEDVKEDDVLKILSKSGSKKRKKGYHYSDLNYAILGMVLERIENKNIKTLLNDFIVNDLKLENTYVGECGLAVESVRRNRYIKNWTWYDDNPFICAGGIISNVVDLIKLSDLVINSDLEYIKNASVICPQSKSHKKKTMTTYSFHTYQKSNQLWHIGSVGTHRAMIIINKNRKLASVVLCNIKGKRKGNACYICKMLYGGLKRGKQL